MIRVNKNENFPILVSLVDESSGQLVSGETVSYDIRTINDSILSPPISGTLNESTVEQGIYKTIVSILISGSFICYATCSGFITNTEDIIVNPESIYELTKQNRNYNISVEEAVRTNESPTLSQTARKVGLNKTDYIVTKIKSDDESDWSSTTTSGITYAHYYDFSDDLPYRMGGAF
ncbi:MAG: hypothetical protein WCQ65_09965 [Fermentimonas sp.]